MARALGPPLLALLLAEALLWVAATRCGQDPTHASTWVRWDSYRYIDIARQGYVDAANEPSESNTGWFPGFPYLLRLVYRPLHARPARAGRAVALVFELGLLTLVWSRLLPKEAPLGRRWLALLAAAVFPGFFYRHAVFPTSMVTFFVVAAIALAARGWFLAAGASGALGAFTYHMGVLVAAPLALEAVVFPGLSLRGRLRAFLGGSVLATLGLAAVLGLHEALVGRWDAFLRYQQQDQDIGRQAYNPLGVLAGNVRVLLRGSREPSTLVSLQVVLVTALILLAAWLFWREGAARRPVDGLLLTHAAVFWLAVCAAGPAVALYRQAAVLVGLVPLLSRLRTPLLLLLLVAFVALDEGMAALFFETVLV